MKKVLILAMLVLGLLALVACGNNDNNDASDADVYTADAGTTDAEDDTPAPVTLVDPTGAIHVITREDGSGTRDAFVEVTGVHYDGVDRTWTEALVETGTGAVITSVAGNPAAMGYISLGALRDDVRALPVDGVEASVANVLNGSYPLFRSFYLALPGELSDLAQDFLNFIVSEEGQAEIQRRGFIPVVDNPAPYTGGGLTGTLVIEGSTSVAPLMGYLVEVYRELNPGVTIDVHSTGSGAGITAAMEARVDIGMSSRALRETELASVDGFLMNHDGLAVIVHPTNGLANITTDEIRYIFIGELTRWEDIGTGFVATVTPDPEPTLAIPTGAIHVITREDGSGTRDAFVNVTGVYQDGVDRTWTEALVETGTGAVITSVAGNPAAMGYISLGALRDDVRALPVDGVEASVDNVLNGSYTLFRSFYLALPGELSDLAQDFLDFIVSEEGQAEIQRRGFITVVENPASYAGGGLTGTLVIEGSTSVAPLMGYLVEVYREFNPGVTIDVHSTGSGAGITAAMEARVDIGMSSRALRETELESVEGLLMNHDGLAVIVHPSNELANITTDEIRDIFIGELTQWENIR